MATFSFTGGNGALIKCETDVPGIAPVRLKTREQLYEIRDSKNGVNVVVDFIGVDNYDIDPAEDTVTIGETEYAAGSQTVDQMIALFNASTVFQKANSSSGGTATLQTVLESPDGTQFLLGVDNTGALITSELSEPVGGALETITLTSEDDTEWEVSISNEGVLITTEI